MMEIQPIHTFIAIIIGILGIFAFLWRMTRSIVSMEMKLNMLWSDFKKRYEINSNNG